MPQPLYKVVENMERETRIELATNSLEGCDSTIELLPLNVPDRNRYPSIVFGPVPAGQSEAPGAIRLADRTQLLA